MEEEYSIYCKASDIYVLGAFKGKVKSIMVLYIFINFQMNWKSCAIKA